MDNSTIENLNIVLTKTLHLKEGFQELSEMTTGELSDKLKELAKDTNRQSETLMKGISDFGGDVETTERQTDQASINWVSHPLPDANDKRAILECLLNGEKKREDELNTKFSGKDVDREVKNLLMKYKQKNESNLVYFQTALKKLKE
ncbi:MAG: hypothetical protein WBG48_06415 [Pricia sp.]